MGVHTDIILEMLALNMGTFEKYELIGKLLLEVANEIDFKAGKIEESDFPLFRLLTENRSSDLKVFYKRTLIKEEIETVKMLIESADANLTNNFEKVLK